MRNIFIVVVSSFLLFACPTPGDSSDSGNGNGMNAGDSSVYSVGSIDITLKYCPGGTFNFGGLDDNDLNGDGIFNTSLGEGSPANIDPFWICDTEVTYELWYTVYQWAINNGYIFQNAGREGNDGTDGASFLLSGSNAEPVSYINWRDCIVFCNALTEWSNTNNGTNLSYVYTKSDIPIKDSTDSNGSNCDSVDENYDNTGFRLLENLEWECAARYKDGTTWTSGSYLSGADFDYTNTTECDLVAVWNTSSTAPVKSKRVNVLGCYDMSGNICELTSTNAGSGSYRWARGGMWNATASGGLVIGWSNVAASNDVARSDNLGLRIGKSSK